MRNLNLKSVFLENFLVSDLRTNSIIKWSYHCIQYFILLPHTFNYANPPRILYFVFLLSMRQLNFFLKISCFLGIVQQNLKINQRIILFTFRLSLVPLLDFHLRILILTNFLMYFIFEIHLFFFNFLIIISKIFLFLFSSIQLFHA